MSFDRFILPNSADRTRRSEHCGIFSSSNTCRLEFLSGGLPIESSPRYLAHVLAVCDGLLFTGVVAGIIAENSSDLLIELCTTVTHEQDLEGLLDGDAGAEVLVVHEESYEIVELAGLEVLLVADTPLVHSLKFVLGYVTVEVVIDLPDNELNFGTSGLATEELEGTGDVHGRNLVQVILLSGVTSGKEVKHTVQLLLLDRLDLDGLEDLSGALLQFFHLAIFKIVNFKLIIKS